MAAAVLRLLEDRELATAIARRGRALVESSYGWPQLADHLEAVLLEASSLGPRHSAVASTILDGSC
jgi:glycosyltransferase involved in cell wall biosynthesis